MRAVQIWLEHQHGGCDVMCGLQTLYRRCKITPSWVMRSDIYESFWELNFHLYLKELFFSRFPNHKLLIQFNCSISHNKDLFRYDFLLGIFWVSLYRVVLAIHSRPQGSPPPAHAHYRKPWDEVGPLGWSPCNKWMYACWDFAVAVL
jgi:hypothetical protein